MASAGTALVCGYAVSLLGLAMVIDRRGRRMAPSDAGWPQTEIGWFHRAVALAAVGAGLFLVLGALARARDVIDAAALVATGALVAAVASARILRRPGPG
jgi:hypothetical protein